MERALAEVVPPRDLIATVRPAIETRSREAWLVGGWVRDWLLGQVTRDIDIVVTSGAIAAARQVADLVGGAFFPLDKERDTARVIVGAGRATTYLDIAGLRAPSIAADLLARDLTINAMAVPLATYQAPWSHLIDPAGGRRDLEQGLVRAVSPDSFRADPLRLLRAVRQGAALGFALEKQTLAWIERDASELDSVSRERIRDELVQMLDLPSAEQVLRRLDSLGLLERIVPELARLRALPGSRPEADALDHAFETVGAAETMLGWLRSGTWEPLAWPGDLVQACLDAYRERLLEHMAETLVGRRCLAVLWKLAALLHDVGKGGLTQTGAGGYFLGHDVLGAAIVATVARRLCFSGTETNRLRLAVRSHMLPGELVQESSGELPRRSIYRFFRDAGPSSVDAILLSLVDHLAARGPTLDRDHWRRHLAASAALLGALYERRTEIVEPEPVVDGHDLIRSFALRPGPQVGGLLEGIREAQAAGQVRSRAEALELARRLLESGGPP